jgi:hypothetical protein
MSSKRYEYKVLESSDLAEFEQQLTTVGGEGWSAVGYGVLPNGSRSALLQRKQHDHGHDERHHHHRRSDHHRPHRHEGPAS